MLIWTNLLIHPAQEEILVDVVVVFLWNPTRNRPSVWILCRTKTVSWKKHEWWDSWKEMFQLKSQVLYVAPFWQKKIRNAAVIITLSPQRAPLCTCQPGSGPVLYGSLPALTLQHVQRSGSTGMGHCTRVGFHRETAYEWQSKDEGMESNIQ